MAVPAPSPATPTRAILGAVRALSLAALVALGAALTHPLYLFALREAYRLGERAGITSATARLAGQIKGFNYRVPPAWYVEVSLFAAVSLWVGPAMLLALLIDRWRSRPRRFVQTVFTPCALRAAVALVPGVLCISIALGHLAVPAWEAGVFLFERLGASTTRLGTRVVGADGPFTGNLWIDGAGNFTLRHGIQFLFVVAGTLVALISHRVLWRSADRRARAVGLCLHCGYDLAWLAPHARCPECGHAPSA